MPNAADLQYLVRLLEDDSEVVRESVLKELSAFGPFLEIEMSRSNVATDPAQRHHIRNLLGQHARDWLVREWPRWKNLPDDKARLEEAMAVVAEFQYGPGYPAKLAPLLDRLAKDYRSSVRTPSPLSLASFLFKSHGLRGAEKDYYSPFHSNLLYVLEERQGNPLSLCCVFILVGHRVDLDIEGCNIPGHFLARALHKGDTYVVDCYNGGRFLEKNDILHMNQGVSVQIGRMLEADCPAETIIVRMLRNLVHSYHQEDKPENAGVFAQFLSEYESPENLEGEDEA